MADRIVHLRGGRSAGVQGRGDPISDRLVVFCHPAPGSGAFDPDPLVTDGWGVQLIGIDRPGYGASPPLPDDTAPSIADRADDVAEYLQVVRAEAEALGLEGPRHVGVVGWSAGGRVAMALAARHPELVDRLAVIATPAPDSAVEWIPRPLAAANADLAARPPAEAKARLRAMLEECQPAAAAADPERLGATDADAAVLAEPGVRGRLDRMLTDAYRQGQVGVADDILSFATDDWGFDPGDIRAKTLLIYGGADAVTDSAHGRWYRRRIRHAKLQVVSGAGHLVVVPAWRDVLRHVAPQPDGA